MYLDYAVCFYTNVLYSVLLLAMMRHDHCDCFTNKQCFSTFGAVDCAFPSTQDAIVCPAVQ